jgi:hypothetical protein
LRSRAATLIALKIAARPSPSAPLHLLADLAHFPLPAHRRQSHQRRDAELAQRVGNLFHFGRAALAVARHALEIVGHELRPIEAAIVVLHRGGDFVDHSGARGGEEAFERQRFEPLMMTPRTILMAAAAPTSVPATLACIPSAASVGAIGCACGPPSSIGVRCRAGWMGASTATST